VYDGTAVARAGRLVCALCGEIVYGVVGPPGALRAASAKDAVAVESRHYVC
jgi:hypothetical protein